MSTYLNLIAKERNAKGMFVSTYGRLYGEGLYVMQTSNFRLPKEKDRSGNNPLTLAQARDDIHAVTTFAYAEARTRERVSQL